MSGSTVGGFVGLVVGTFFGAPQIGFMLGSALGGIVDPQVIKGPRLTDAQKQTSQEGAPIPFGFGSYPSMGNIIWEDVLVEHKHKEGGKGGPQQVTYTYTRSFAIMFGEAPYPDGIAGFLQVRINGKLVYDVSPDSEIAGDNAKFLEYATLYNGSETQDPDPTMEAVKGAGNVSAHRGSYYIVFADYDCTETQGAIPQVEVVTRSCGTVTDGPATPEAVANFYFPMIEGGSSSEDVKGTLPDLVYQNDYTATGSGVTYNDLNAFAEVFTGSGALDGSTVYTIGAEFRVNSVSLVPSTMRLVAGNFNNYLLGYCGWALFLGGPNKLTPMAILGNGGGAGVTLSADFEVALGQSYHIGVERSGSTANLLVNDHIADTFTGTIPNFSGTGHLMSGGYGLTAYGGQMTVSHIWGSTTALSVDDFTDITIGLGVLPDGWTEVPDAPGVLIDPDGVVHTESSTSIDDDCVTTVGEVVADLCEREGIDPDEYDVSELTDEIKGFSCAAGSGADAYIEALRMGYFFDCAEFDKKLHFPKRGKAAVASLTTDDLLRLDESGPSIQWTQIQEPELLRKVNVLTLDPAAEYRMGKQTAERRAGTIQAKGESTVEIPLVCPTNDAAKMAEKRLKLAWAETDKAKLGLPPKWSKLTAADDINLTDANGITHRVRLQDMNEQAGVITIEEAVKNRANVYTGAVATGSSNDNSTGGGSSLAGPTKLVVMNLPRLRSQDTSGVYVGLAGMLPGWKGAQLLLSFDGGLTYFTALSVGSATKLGELTSDCASSGEPVQVRVWGGQLSSATTAQVDAGANYSAIQSAGVAEIFSYEDATVTATDSASEYDDLETTVRGLTETTAASHSTGDAFMDLNTCYFVAIDTAYAGQTIYAKAVSLGTSADAVTAVTFVYEGLTRIIDGGEIT